MAYRFHLKAPVGKEARRIMLEQVERAERQLEGALESAHKLSNAHPEARTGVHETRKAMKRIRALLKLIRPGLSDDDYQAENGRFREIAALLAASRDQAVLIETVQKLRAHNETLADPAVRIVAYLAEHEESGEQPNGAGHNQSPLFEEARDKLHATKHHIRRLRLDPDSFAALEEGLRQGFKRAQNFRATAAITNEDEDVHSWRKAVQQHWRHMALLQRAWPDVFLARVALARRISQLLGDDHDLSMLATKLRSLPAKLITELQQQEVIEAALAEQRRLRAEAHLLSALLFTGRPRAFGDHIRDVWTAAAALPDAIRPYRSSSDGTTA